MNRRERHFILPFAALFFMVENADAAQRATRKHIAPKEAYARVIGIMQIKFDLKRNDRSQAKIRLQPSLQTG